MWGCCSTSTNDVISNERQTFMETGRPSEEMQRYLLDRVSARVARRIEERAVRVPRLRHHDFVTGAAYTEWVLEGNPRNLPEVYHIDRTSFDSLTAALVGGRHFAPETKGVQVNEALLMFLYVVSGDARFRPTCHQFQHSSETVSRIVGKVRNALAGLSASVICPLNDQNVHPRIRNDRRLYPYFKDCVGSIDGTHIEAAVPARESTKYRNRKGALSQNVLAVVDNHSRFVYVMVGMAGCAHDASVLEVALSDPRHMFPVPPVGKYYAVDSAYKSMAGFMCPFRGKPYHAADHHRSGFRDKEELFNHRHSSTRNVVERAFGVLKKKFQFLTGPTYNYNWKAQGNFVLACCTVYNTILMHNPYDPDLNELGLFDNQVNGDADDDAWMITTCNLQPGERSPEAVAEWNAYRQHIAEVMWANHV